MLRTPYAGLIRMLKRFAAAAALLGLLAVPALASAQQAQSEAQYDEVRELIRQLHINGDNVGDPGTIDGLLESLGDPYTEYFDEEEWKKFNDSLDLQYPGIGIRLGQDDTGFVVVQVFAGSPAEKAGLQRGDHITAVADQSAAGLTLDEVTKLIRGPDGSEVSIRVDRGGQQVDVKAKRGEVRLPVVEGGMLDGGFGYVKVASFSADADELFAAKLKELKDGGVKGLVIDLRDNPGGILDTAKHIAEQFIPSGVLIHTRDKNGLDDPVVIENGQSVAFPVVVLVNGNSASASEVLTAALQDHGKATAVGEKTYGKGSVQGLYELQSGGTLKVTVQEYLSPNKRQVNHVGLTPDIEVEGYAAQLIAGLRTAGLDDLKLELPKWTVKLNGMEFFDFSIPKLEKDGETYVPARVLAAMVGLPLVWNESLWGVEIGEGETKTVFDEQSGFTIDGGTGFIALGKFRERFPQLNASVEPDRIVLTVKGNGN
jgi:carboxyl-terminal processing protease